MKNYWILALGLNWLLAFTLNNDVLAQDKQELTRPQVPLEQLLNRDGTLDLKKDFRGSLDPANWQMVTGPNGEPRFVPTDAMQRNSNDLKLAAAPGDENWDDRFALPGLNATVLAIAVSGSEVYVGGNLTEAGGVTVNRIAKWNGMSWSALGSGMNGAVYAIAVSGSDVYVGGIFTTAGGVPANFIAKWNGTSWSALGSGMNGIVYAIAVSGSDVYAGGVFTTAGGVAASRIAKWDGTSWVPLADGMNADVLAIAVSGGDVYAGGNFTIAGGVSASRVAKWNGSSWSPLGSGVNSSVRAIAVGGNEVYAGGSFGTAGGIAANHIAKWDGASWSALGSGMRGGVYTIAVSGSDVYAGADAFGGPGNFVSKWDGTNWSALGFGGSNGVVNAVAVRDNHIYVGGNFRVYEEFPADYVAEWNGSTWSGLNAPDRQGMNSNVYAIAVNGSAVYVGGGFSTAGGVPVHQIAKWNGSSWSTLGNGMGGVFSSVSAIAVSGSDVYVGGGFTTAGGVPAQRIAKWNGSGWSPLGSGMNGNVLAIAVSGPDVYVGGEFTTAGGVPARGIAKWNGTSWSALGNGLNNNTVRAIAVSGSDVYAAGGFRTAGGESVIGIAKWNGTDWAPLGSGVIGAVSAIAASGSEVYVGGGLISAGGVPVNYIAKWDGTSWSPLSSGVNSNVFAMTFSGSDLYVGGSFTTAGGAPANRCAVWNGTSWGALGSGTNDQVNAVAVSGNHMYVGGRFSTAGNKPSSFLGHYYLGIPPTPALLSPVNGARQISRTPTLTWSSSAGAAVYQLQVSLTSDFNSTIVNDTAVVGSSRLVGALSSSLVHYWRVRAKNAFGTSDWSEIWSFIPELLPDLQIAQINVPTSAFSGNTIQVQWTVTNLGETGSNTPQWFDRVYLSSNPTFDLQAATVVGTYENFSSLATGESYTNNASVTLPQGVAGDRYIFVWTDVNSQAPEVLETNNIGRNTTPIQVKLAPAPDLQVTSLIMPHEAFSGDSITVQWTVTNLGAASTDVNQWVDAVFLSPDSVLNFVFPVNTPMTIRFSDPQFASVPHNGTLAAASSYSASARFALHRQNHGKYWLYVYADMRTRFPELALIAKERGDVYEHVYDFNNTREDTIRITLAPLPDLIVTSVTSPDSASTNQAVTISWRVQNVGLAPTFESLWSDQVFISKSPTFQSNSVQALAAFDHTGSLLRDSSYARSGTVIIPAGYAGPAYLYVKTDWRNQVLEYSDSTQIETENVNRNGRSITAQPPDLFTTNVTIPKVDSSGTTTTLRWTVRNLGPGKLVNATWRDRVYLSRLPVFNADSSIVLGSFTRSGTLGKDSSYTVSSEVMLPNGIEGPFYVYVKADWENLVFENNVEGNNLRRSDTTLQIALSPWPDLQPTITSVPPNAVAGQQVQMTWQVRNAGTASTQRMSWVDRLYLSTQPTLDAAIVVGSVAHTGLLAPAGSYTAASLVTLPPDLRTSTYYLFLKTDADTAVYEHTDEGNNVARSNAIPVSAYPPVDLRVSAITTPSSGQSGLPIALQVKVENIGTGKTLAASWTDAVYLSTDSLLNENLDTRLLRIGHTGALDGGQSYTLNRSVLLPNGSSGTYYILVKTDADNQVNEISRSNNLRSSLPIAITLTLSADLVVDSLTAPTHTTAGQPITLRWRIGNHGKGRTNSPTWYEAVYLSADAAIDNSDLQLGTYRRDGGLEVARSYADTMRVELPSYVAGPYYLIMKTDNGDQVYEHNAENNNTQARAETIMLAPAADLIVTRVAVPGNAVPGEPLTVSWTIRNIGSNPAVGWLRDAVYISPDTAWQVADPLVGVEYRFINLAPRTSQVISKRVKLTDASLADSIGNVINPLPGVTPGTYRVIVRTNIRSNIREVTLANNALASQDTVGVDLPTLVPGIPSTGALAEGQMRYFKINVAANLDLRLRLTSNVNDASNEIYVAYNRVPNFNDYDLAGTTPLSSEQEITVSSTRQGTYYILLFSRAASAIQTFSLNATLLPFSISEVTPDHGGTGGQVTSTVYGAGFRDSTRFVLKTGSSQVVEGRLLRLVNSTEAKVRWDLLGIALGSYDVLAINSDNSIAVRSGGFNVEHLQAGRVATFSDGPSVLRLGSISTYSISFVNGSNVDIPYLPIRLTLRGNARIESMSWTGGMSNIRHLDTTITRIDYPEYIVLHDPSDGSQFTVIDFLAKDVPPGHRHQVTLQVRPLAGLGGDRVGLYASYGILARNDFMDRILVAAAEVRLQILNSELPESVKFFAHDSTAFFQLILTRLHEIGLLELGGSLVQNEPHRGSSQLMSLSLLEKHNYGACELCKDIEKIVCAFIHSAEFSELLICLTTGPGVVHCFVVAVLGGIASHLYCTFVKDVICEAFWCYEPVRPHDPNDITGPPGFGTQGWVQRTQEMPYTIRFENDPLLATAPAQTVTVTQTLDTTIDIRTFRLGAFGFGSFVFNPPANVAHYSSRLDVRDSLGVFVDVVAGVDVPANRIFWTFRSIDPVTGLPPANPLAGFLPVEDSLGHGQGFVNYTIRPKSTTHTGDVINAQASIVFDVNNPIVTPSIFNTVDADVPVSSMIPPAIRVTETSYRLRWAGVDLGSGIAGYTIYASHQDSAFVPWLSNTTDTSAIFTGIQGDRYRFYSIATDGAGNVGVPSAPLVITGVEEKQMPPRVFALSNNYPNPFNPLTAINYDVPRKSLVTIKIYNLFGQEVYTLVNEQKDAGRYTATWNGINNQNLPVASGVYLIRMKASDYVQVKKMMVLK